jgi:hypothetical protein
MSRPRIVQKKNGSAVIFWGAGQFERQPRLNHDDPLTLWAIRGQQVGRTTAQLLECFYQNPDKFPRVQRFPRLPWHAPTINFDAIPRLADIPKHNVHWMVDGLIPSRTLTLLAAQPGDFKTWLSLYLAGSVSRGETFLGRTTERTQVLYLDRDNPYAVTRQRLAILGIREGDQLRVWGNWLQYPPPLIGDHRLLDFAQQRPLIIFDSFLRFHSADENSAKEMARVMEALRRLVTAGATVLVLHHSPKSKQSAYRGSTDIHAGVDVAFELSVNRGTDPPILSLNCFKHRFLPEFQLKLRPHLDCGEFAVTSDPVAMRADTTTQKLKTEIERRPGQSQEQLISQLGLPERMGRDVLQAGTGTHWTAKRGNRKTLLYYPIS